jgi:uncharacterized protein DUF4352
MAGVILLCCGIGPFAVITVIDIVRHSSSGSAGQGITASASHPPSAQARAPQPAPPAPPPATPPASPTGTPLNSVPAAPAAPAAPPAGPPSAAPHAPRPEQQQSQQQQAQPPAQAQPHVPAPASPPRVIVPAPPVTPAPPPPAAPPARIGDTVRDGQLEFVVREVKCGLKQIGTDPRSVHTQGQFCAVTISVRNVGDRPQTIFEMEQKAFGANGSEYSAHSIAGLLANEPDNTDWLSEISPGGQVTGRIVYDLPKGIDLALLELNDPVQPGGVKVILR